MSPDLHTVSQIPSLCNCNCSLKDFHDFRDFYLLREFYSQYSHSKEAVMGSGRVNPGFDGMPDPTDPDTGPIG